MRERYDARGSESRRLCRMASAGGRVRTAQQKDGALHSSTATVSEWRGRPESIQRELQRGRMLAMAMTATSGTPSTHTRVHAQARTSTHAQHTRSTCARAHTHTHTHTHTHIQICLYKRPFENLGRKWSDNRAKRLCRKAAQRRRLWCRTPAQDPQRAMARISRRPALSTRRESLMIMGDDAMTMFVTVFTRE